MNDSVILNSILDQVYEVSKELKLLHKKVDLIESLLNKNTPDNNTESNEDDATEEQYKNMQFALAAQNTDKKTLSNEEIASQFNKAKEDISSGNSNVDTIVESQKSSVDEETKEKIKDSISGISDMIGRMKSIESLEYDIEKHIGL